MLVAGWIGGEIVMTGSDVWNVRPRDGAQMNPYDIEYGVKLDMSTIHTFGCMAYVKRPEELQIKLDARMVKCRYLGIIRAQLVCIEIVSNPHS
jgi:hypothetical protein